MTPDKMPSVAVTFSSPKRARATSHTESRPQQNDELLLECKRHHSASVSLVTSQMSEDSRPYFEKKSYEFRDMDLEKQLIISAGGSDASVCCFLLKMLLLTTVVLGCGVLVFYAL